jgi:hypothetical protein
MDYPGAFLIDFLIEPEENIYPIVPPGESLARFFEPSKPEVLEEILGTNYKMPKKEKTKFQ